LPNEVQSVRFLINNKPPDPKHYEYRSCKPLKAYGKHVYPLLILSRRCY
jgi:hypothetical protein